MFDFWCKTWISLTKAGGISVFIRPVNISENLAVFNSGWCSNALAIAFAASTPRVLPVRARNCRSGHSLIALTIGWAEKEKLKSYKSWTKFNTICIDKYIKKTGYIHGFYNILRIRTYYIQHKTIK